MMIPDTARTFPDLSDGASKPGFINDLIYSSLGLDDFFDVEDFEHILLSDNPIDEDLYPSSLDDDFYNKELYDDDCQYLWDTYNLHEEPYQEKLNAAAIEAAALKSSCHALFSPELCHIVNPNEIFIDHNKRDNKIRVTDEFVLNNTRKGEKDGEIVYVRGDDEVHNDHSYVKEEEEVVMKVRIKEEPIDEGYNKYYHQNVVVKVEPPPVKRPVGRPRKTPIASKPIKRPAPYFEETNEEFVDVESIDVKRPRKTPKPRATRTPAPKKPGRRKTKKPSISSEESCSPTHFQAAIDPLNPNGYVMRQAKTTALKKMTKTKKKSPPSPATSRSKRSDHNDMERRRRHEMRDLFEELKVLVPTDLLVDDHNKIKKNPSKNTILVGSRTFIEILYQQKLKKNSLVRQNQKLQLRRSKLVKSLKKRCKKLKSMSRRYVC